MLTVLLPSRDFVGAAQGAAIEPRSQIESDFMVLKNASLAISTEASPRNPIAYRCLVLVRRNGRSGWATDIHALPDCRHSAASKVVPMAA